MDQKISLLGSFVHLNLRSRQFFCALCSSVDCNYSLEVLSLLLVERPTGEISSSRRHRSRVVHRVFCWPVCPGFVRGRVLL